MLRDLLATMSPAMLGLETGPYYNLRSLLRRASGLAGKAIRPRARNGELNADWAPLYGRLPTRRAKARLGGFISYASAEGYAPDEICDGHLARYAQTLQSEALDPKYAQTVERTGKEWNRAADELAYPHRYVRPAPL